MKKFHTSAAALLLALAACSKPGTVEEAQGGNSAQAQDAPAASQMSPAEKAARANAGGADNAPYYLKLPLNEFMPHVMQYAGDGIWKRQGYIIDKDGEHSLFPKNDEDWEQAESAAHTLVEVTNVLLIPGRRVPDPEWDKAVLAVRAVALKAVGAAEKKDAKSWFEIGGELDEACDVCHVRFDPTFKGKPGPA
jgi:hypothetical protein